MGFIYYGDYSYMPHSPCSDVTQREPESQCDNLGFARVDLARLRRQGVPEVVYGAGKTGEQIAAILESLRDHGQTPALVTRIDSAKAATVSAAMGNSFEYFPDARLGRLGSPRAPDGHGPIVIAAAGTSDIHVAEEAALTAETLGNEVKRLYDIGVAGLHRLIGEFYGPFHQQVESVLGNHEYSHVSRELGTAPDGQKVTASFGKFGAYVQKGEGETRQFASLGKGQLIETITLEDALKLFELPRTVGEHEGIPVIATKGKYGPYLKYGDRNIKLPRGADPLKINLEECVALITESAAAPAANAVIAEWGDIRIINGRYGPYLKSGEENYRIPKGTDATKLTLADCQALIEKSAPTAKGKRHFKK